MINLRRSLNCPLFAYRKYYKNAWKRRNEVTLYDDLFQIEL